MSSDTGMSEYAQLHRIANDLHKSRLFRTGSVEQTLAVILMGRELGVGPTTALSNIIISAGKPTLGAALVGALIQRSGRYFYTVATLDDKEAVVEFFENTGPNGAVRHLGQSRFTIVDAQRARLAGSQTWQQYPRNLLLARAITNGARWYTPSVFGGAIYDPEELGIAGLLTPPEGRGEQGGATSSAADAPGPDGTPPPSSPSGGDAVDAEFVPAPEGITIEGLLERHTAEQILEANGGSLPQTDEDLRRVFEALSAP